MSRMACVVLGAADIRQTAGHAADGGFGLEVVVIDHDARGEPRDDHQVVTPDH